MVHHVEMENFLNRVLNVLNARIAEFHYAMTFRTNQVIVLLVAERLFVLCEVLAKLVLAHEIAFH